MQAADLLQKNPDPADAEIEKAMQPILCRCMTYPRMKKAIKATASDMKSSAGNQPAAAAASQSSFQAISPGAGETVLFGWSKERGAARSESKIARNLWFEIDAEGRTTINITKAEMGQHVGTALAQSLAEELEVRWEDVRIRHVDTDPKWGVMITGGSWSVNWTFDTLSRAGAAGRIALIEAGAGLLKVDPAGCYAENSEVIDRQSKRSVSYAKIIRDATVSFAMEEAELAKIELKKASAYKLVGQSLPALDIAAKTNGSATYGIDVFLPGMAYGRLVTPPVRYGAKVLGIDDTEARKVSGFLQAVALEDPTESVTGFVVCVGETYGAAEEGAKALKVEWDNGPNQDVDSLALTKAAEELTKNPTRWGNWVLDGDAEKHLAGAAKTLTVAYTTCLNLHAPLEPANAVVEHKDGIWHAYTGNQNQLAGVPLMAKALGVDESKVVIHQHYLGGGFGKRLDSEYIAVAALTAKAVGRPVKVMYTREQDMQFDFPRSPSLQVLSGALGGDGRLEAVIHDVVAGWPTARVLPGLLAETADKEAKVDSFAVSGADFWYSVPHHRVRAIQHDLVQKAIPPGYLRAVGPGFTTFAVECFMDEMAALAGVDPAVFRLAMLDAKGKQAGEAPNSVGGASRLENVLKRAVERSGYGGKSLPGNSAMGLACSFGQERTMPTWIACVAEVDVNPEKGDFQVKKLTLAADVGTIVNPDSTLAQMQSALLWGLSLATREQASVAKGAIEQKNFHQYQPLRMADIPELEVHLVENDYYPVGTGEPAVGVVAPAIANAIANAVGARVRDLPITPERVRQALEST